MNFFSTYQSYIYNPIWGKYFEWKIKIKNYKTCWLHVTHLIYFMAFSSLVRIWKMINNKKRSYSPRIYTLKVIKGFIERWFCINIITRGSPKMKRAFQKTHLIFIVQHCLKRHWPKKAHTQAQCRRWTYIYRGVVTIYIYIYKTCIYI